MADGLAGFRPGAAGLLVPESISRVREVWTNDEWKSIKRAITLLSLKGLAVVMRCPREGCRETPLETVTNPDGTTTIRCHHLDRVIRKGVPRG